MRFKSENGLKLWAVLLLGGVASAGAAQTLETASYRVTFAATGGGLREVLAIRSGDGWQDTLAAAPSVLVQSSNGPLSCKADTAEAMPAGIVVKGKCGAANFEQRLTKSADDDRLDVSTHFTAADGMTLRSVEDRYSYLPPRNAVIDEHTGPLDFLWSQSIKSEVGDLIASNAFKSPVVMMQQRRLFAALVPDVDDRHMDMRALDLDVTSGPEPWMSFGAIASEPHGHSYFRRAAEGTVPQFAGIVEYRYSILLSDQAPRLGYRRAVRLLWKQFGHPELLRSADEQRNALRPELHSFDQWRGEAWTTYADRVYAGWPCGARQCGTLASDRSVTGDWQHFQTDAWFNPWFETLRTAYGWYLHGRAAGDKAMQAKAESVLNLALTAPRNHGAFSTIYLAKTAQWIPSDGWAGYQDSYDAFSMSWTAYWLLQWAELVPERRAEILAFTKGYGDFLLAHQAASGVIPSWYRAATLEPRPEFRDLNAETAPSALLLATLATASGDNRYRTAAEHAMDYVNREIVPRQRWFDFETYLSCARKPYDFYDTWTAQYPQNNLAEMQAPQALLALYRATGEKAYLEQGVERLDYLLLTQQVWNNPRFLPMLLGGFTTQNTDEEWSDARQAYAATLLADFYMATGEPEYLERAIAAARSTFAVAPWENWAHTGYVDEPGAMTGFHWGTGSAMTSVEMLQPVLGDALVDVTSGQGAGFDECTLTGVTVRGREIHFELASSNRERKFQVRFRGLAAQGDYRVSWNRQPSVMIQAQNLARDGIAVQPLGSGQAGSLQAGAGN